jgi:hypothetical protein
VIRGLTVALLVAVAVTLAPAVTASAAPADDIYALVNQARWANGQAGLIRNAAMDQVAADWVATMAANGTMAHNPDYASQIPGGWTAAAENVARGHSSGTAMHDGWMGSPGHRANILGDYTDIGIAFLSSGGTTWGVQVFGRYPGHVGPAAPAPPPAPPAVEAPAETATPTPTPTTTPTPTATPSRPASDPAASPPEADLRTAADAGWPPWALIAAVLGISAATASTVLRRRSRHGRRARR